MSPGNPGRFRKSFAGYGARVLTGVQVSPSVLTTKVFFSNDPAPSLVGTNTPEYSQTFQDILYVSDTSDLTNKLGWGAELKLNATGKEVYSEEYTKQLDTTTNEESVTFIVINHTYVGYYEAYEESLSTQAQSDILASIPGFIDKYGDTYVKRAYVGGDLAYICTYSYEKNTVLNIDHFKANLNADLSAAFGFTIKGNYDTTQHSVISKTKLKISAFWTSPDLVDRSDCLFSRFVFKRAKLA